MFRKWSGEGTLVRCDFSFPAFAASLRGRIRLVTEAGLRLLADDALSELALDLTADVEFGYAEPRGFPEEAARFGSGLVAFFPGDRDFISFTEIIER